MDTVGITAEKVSDYSGTRFNAGSSMKKDDFLKLLITQMKYQDPMNPADNTQMAAQLAQYSQLETLNNMHETMKTNLVMSQSMNNSYMTSLIGKDIKAYGNSFSFAGKPVELDFYLSSTADAEIKIYDKNGKHVDTLESKNMQGGNRSLTWDGLDESGNSLEEGEYTFSVEAVDASGNPVSTDTFTTGIAAGITYEQGTPYLVINGQYVGLGNVISVNQPGEDG
ncbi:MAG: flagellar hook capping protein [Candidatus Cloacimonadota bacterium]|nr:MAG: flagellar hook capping protein [Candidatus Cloacimonadota bacterium]